jgi:hypothetical protein
MNEHEQRDLARRLADSSNVLDFDAALQIVQFRPAAAEKLLRDKKQRKARLDALARANERLRRAALEFR